MNPLPTDAGQLASRPAYVFLAVVLAIHLTLGSFVQVANPAFGIAFDELFIFAGLTVLLVMAMNYRRWPFLAVRPPLPQVWPATLVAAVGGFFAAGALNALNRLLVGPEIAQRFDVTRLFEVRSAGEGILLVVGVSVLAPLGEELLFRGYLMRVFGARYGERGALLATSLLFAVVHFNPASFIALFALGLVFGLLRLWTGSIWPSMLAHGIQNGAASALVLSGLANQAPDELPAGDAALLLVVSAPFVIAALAWLRRRRPAAGSDLNEALLPADAGAGHQVDPSRVLRPLGLGFAAAIAALLLLFAVDGKAAAARLGRQLGDVPPKPPAAPDASESGEPTPR